MTLKDNLPRFISEEKYTKEVLEALEPEIDNLRLKISTVLLECCISTCMQDGIKRFERDYNLEYNSKLPLSERRKCIINKMLAKKRLTKEELANFIKRNIDNNQFYITNEAEKHCFKVMLIDENYKDALYSALLEARPAHLLFRIETVSYERRCGTFRCAERVF